MSGTTSLCEHACSLRDVHDVPKKMTHVRHKITTQSTAYSNFNELMDTLRKEIAPIDMHTKEHIDHIKTILSRVRINEKEWGQYTNFHDGKYTRNLVGHDEKFTALLLCWNKGQASPIHDHAGSSCWVKVLSGTLQETLYEHGEEGLDVTQVTDVSKDDSCYINDSMGYHKMANPNSNDVTVTLHIYSPPFNFCNAFDVAGNARRVCMLAANAPYESFYDVPSGNGLQAFTHEVEGIMKSCADNEARMSTEVTKALQNMKLTREDWDIYTHFSEFRYTRNLLFSNSEFSVILNCWLPGQGTPIHTHGSGTHSWFKVVGGELAMEFFDDSRNPRSSTKFSTDSPPFFEGMGMHLHRLANNSDEVAVSVHVYNPPYKNLTFADPAKDDAHSTLPVVHCTSGEQCCDTTAGCGSSETVFTNLSSMIGMIDAEFQLERKDCERTCEVMALLERCVLHDEEIEALRSMRRDAGGNVLLLHQNHKVMVEVNFWERGASSSIHDHGESMTWHKVLRGRLSDISFETEGEGGDKCLKVTHSSLLMQNALSFVGTGTKHSLRNGPVCEAVSLHITSPPVQQCNYFTPQGGQPIPQWFVFV